MTTPKPSDILFAATIAAEKALPPESLKLITDHDEMQRAWMKSDAYPKSIPAELIAAGNAIDADPLAHIAMELRRQGNRAASAEWKAAQLAA